MHEYRDFEPEELAADTSFQRWKLFDNPIDKAFWEQWLLGNPDRSEVVDKAYHLLVTLHTDYKRQIDEGESISKQEVKQEIVRLREALDLPKRHAVQSGWWQFTPVRYGMAASFLVLISLLGWHLFFSACAKREITYAELVDHAASSLTEVSNATGEPLRVSLPDRSTILLSPKSRVSYAKSFSGRKREVYLSGEAFFSVIKDPTRPFYVHSNRLVTKVLGTSFIVQAYEGAKQARVIVRTGKVSVYPQSRATATNSVKESKAEGVVLTPNQQLVFSPEESRLVKSIVKKPVLLAPSAPKQLFTFRRTPIAEVFATLEQAYGIRIVFDEDLMRDCYLTAALADEPLYEKLTLIGHTIDATFEQLDGYIIIHSKGCKPRTY
ncbi:FecR family protein [Spirosoma fluminis]